MLNVVVNMSNKTTGLQVTDSSVRVLVIWLRKRFVSHVRYCFKETWVTDGMQKACHHIKSVLSMLPCSNAYEGALYYVGIQYHDDTSKIIEIITH